MRITDLEVDGFGTWRDMRLGGLSEHLHVFYGPNEAGKTTLLQFVRSILYGFSAERRAKYLPPLEAETAGGTLRVTGPQGSLAISRHDDRRHDPQVGRLRVSGADGVSSDEQLLARMLCQVDEPTFNNIFALGLDELHELASLRDTDSAEFLFNLTVGLDRVSLADVERELDHSRLRIIGAPAQPDQVSQLRGERNRLRAELSELGEINLRFARLTQQRATLDLDIARLEADAKAIQDRVRLIEIATAAREKWIQRGAVIAELAGLGDVPAIADSAIQKLDRCNAGIAARRKSIAQLKQEQRRLKAEAAKLPVNEVLSRQAARIEVLGEQHDWLASIEKEIQSLTAEIQELDAKLQVETQRLGLPPDVAKSAVTMINRRTLAPLGPLSRGIRSSRERRDQAQRDVVQQRETVEALEKQLRIALKDRSESELSQTLERTGSLVSILRRRVQVEERLTQMTGHETELEEQCRRLLDRQLLPVPTLIAIGSPFILGVMLTLIGLFLPASITGSLGWVMAALGLIGMSITVGLKIAMERTASRQLDTCRKQLEMLALQISQAREEREKLDAQIPRGGGPLVTRLQSAEGELTAVEELLPLDARRQVARQEVAAASGRAEQAEADFQAARKRWRQVLSSLGLPESLSLTQAQQIRRGCEQIGEIRRRLDRCRQDASERQRTLQGMSQRIADLSQEVGLSGKGNSASQQLQQLRRAMTENQGLITRREALVREAVDRHREQRKQRAWQARWQRRRKALLRAAGTLDENEFRRRAQLQTHIAEVRERRETLTHEIGLARGNWCSDEALRELLETATPSVLDERWDELSNRLQSVERELHQHFEQRGTVGQELKTLLQDRRIEQTQLELSQVEQRLKEACERWQVLAVTSAALTEIRRLYEAERQPETLREASAYLEQLTEGRYSRVWTPLGERVLRVDDADGRTLPVEVLSRGAREQLFLSLRLAIAGIFARRGISLPMILDDILVNFDTRRTKAAAVVLRDFAAQGHQLLVFTCHEHIVKIFHSIKAPVQRLPERGGTLRAIVPDFDEPDAEIDPATQPLTHEEPETQPVAPPLRRPRPAAKRKRRSEVIVSGLEELSESLMATQPQSVRLRRIDPPEEPVSEPMTARVLPPDQYEQLSAAPWDDDIGHIQVEPDHAPPMLHTDFATDVDEYDSRPMN